MRFVLALVVVVVLAMGAGEVGTSAMEVGGAMQANDARLSAAYGIGE